MHDESKCVVCKRQDASISKATNPYVVKCPQCGMYNIRSIEYQQMFNSSYPPLFSAWIRSHSEGNHSSRTIAEISSTTWSSIQSSLRLPTVREKQAALMKFFSQQVHFPGMQGRFTPDADFTVAWADNAGELRFLMDDLKEQGLLDAEQSVGQRFLIKAKGWEFLENLPTSGVFSDQVFVAMSFSTAMKSVWENAIAPAVSRAGYTPYRVDASPHIERIDTKIMAEIKGSRFVVADVTEQKAGVYFEAGYAIGQGLPVIWAVRQDDLKNVHFDTRQYAHIVWQNEAELEAQLYNFIVAVIGAKKH